MAKRRAQDRLTELLEQFPAVVLLGPRQVGKTTLARAHGEASEGVYLDLESRRDQRKLSDPEDYLLRHLGKLVVLDEIQRLPGLFPSLRGLIDESRHQGHRSNQFLLLGSASLDLIEQSSETLVGRIAYLELHPIDASEVKSDQINTLWLRGGFPESLLAANDSASSEYRDFLIRSYLERDVALYGGRLAPQKLRRLWTMLAHSQGTITNVAALSKSLEINVRTVNSYIDLLENMLLLRRIQPWSTNTKKRLVKSPKIYVRDSGLLHELLGIESHETLLGHPIVGASWEGFVIENLIACAPSRTEVYFYRTSAGAEIDLLMKFRNGDLWAIEIKRGLSQKVTKGFYSALQDTQPSRSFIVYGGGDHFKTEHGSEMIGLRILQELLLDMR